MISFHSKFDFTLDCSEEVSLWLSQLVPLEGKKLAEVSIIFCTDDQLLEYNVKYLDHNTLTDIISFDYSLGNTVSGDVFISIDRVRENAVTFGTSFNDELQRVMAHGLLHYCGYQDKSKEQKVLMREKEDYYLSLRTF